MIPTAPRPYTLADPLRAALPYLTPPLIAPDALTRTLTIAEQFPLFLSDVIGFETYLNVPASAAGIACNVSANAPGWQVLSGARPGFPAALAGIPVWQRIRSLAAAVHNPDHALGGRISNLWLEFDIERPDELTPDVYVGLAAPTAPRSTPAARPLVSITEQLTGAPVDPALLAAFDAALAALPVTAQPNQLGLMLARPVQALRLISTFSDAAALPDYLTRLGWPGDHTALTATLTRALPHSDLVTLQTDLTSAGLLPRVGVELRFADAGDFATAPRWDGLLHALATAGDADADRCAALLAYRGVTRRVWTLPVLVQRGLSHVKYVWQPGQPPVTKIYFGVRVLWQ